MEGQPRSSVTVELIMDSLRSRYFFEVILFFVHSFLVFLVSVTGYQDLITNHLDMLPGKQNNGLMKGLAATPFFKTRI